ncbi:hypothetical protein [Algibacter pacificus]|uniref:hypothetical protein n=1 Tax=Algibacter pacificus TaxID=2599389 RepID=UPI0011CACE0A|nr:hypothetical protein [Algibacter pacificus]
MEYILIFTGLLLLIFLLYKLKKTKGSLAEGKLKRNIDLSTSIVKSDVEKLELKGPVKSIKDEYWIISVNDGEVKKQEPFDYTITKEFDVKGNLTDTVVENNNPYYKNIESNKLFYGDKGELIEEKKYNLDGKLLWKKSFRYNKRDKISEWVNFNVEGIGLGRITFEYDLNNNKIYSMLYRYDESLYGKLNYEYDKYGNCLNQYKEDTFCNPIMAIREIVYYEV